MAQAVAMHNSMNAGPVVQNQTGSVNLHAAGIAFDMGNKPIVEPGSENRTIAIEMDEPCCGQDNFNAVYQPKTSLTQAQFDEVIAEFNAVVKMSTLNIVCCPCFCMVECCCDVTKRKLRKKCEEMTTRYINQKVEFMLNTKDQLVVGGIWGDMDGHLFPDEKYFLIIRQN